MLPEGRGGTEAAPQAQRPVLEGGQRPLRVVCFLFIFYTVIFFYFFVVFFFLLCVYIPFQFFFFIIFFFFFDVTLGIAEVIVALATPCGRPGHSAH